MSTLTRSDFEGYIGAERRQRQAEVDHARVDRALGHPPEARRARVLREGDPAVLPDRRESGGAVGSGSGEDHADGLPAALRRERSEEEVDGEVGPALVRLMQRPDSTPQLGLFERPTLVVCGQEDEITGPDVARQMHGQVAGAQLALIGHAGHLSNLEQPAAFNAALDRFLATRFVRP
jgi:pimeloyl-ACP methyl ester carboxylesterase